MKTLGAISLTYAALLVTATGCSICQNPYDCAGPVRSGPYASGTTRQASSYAADYAAVQGADPAAQLASNSGNVTAGGWSASGNYIGGATQGIPPEGVATAPAQPMYR